SGQIFQLKSLVNRVYTHPLIRSLHKSTQISPRRNTSLAARILNSPLFHPDIYLGLSSHLGLEVSASMTHTSKGLNLHARMPPTTQRHQRG
uniref:Ovule protein n=1 Tax=Mesocestoides corti TaxID=53468 RepID=A0A5K3G353_MESCO